MQTIPRILVSLFLQLLIAVSLHSHQQYNSIDPNADPYGERTAQEVVLITGASKGIGYSIAKVLVEKGHTIYAGVRSTSQLDNLKELQKKHGDRFHIIMLDVTDQESVDEAVKTILSKEHKIDVLVNNAGILMYGSPENMTIQEAEQIFAVNFFGVLRVTNAVLPTMRAQKSGKIIQISSRSGFRPLPSISIYAASKFALEAMSETLQAYVKPFNITVSLIQPGPVRTELDLLAAFGTNLPRDIDPYYPVLIESGLMEVNDPSTQEPEEIADIVEKIIVSSCPRLRYQTTQAIEVQASRRLVDITGKSNLEELEALLYSK